MLVKLTIQRTTTHEKFTVEIDDQRTIKDLAILLEDDFESGPVVTLKVIHKGKILKHETIICQIPNATFDVDIFVILNSNKDKSQYKIRHQAMPIPTLAEFQTLVSGPAVPIYKKDPPPLFATNQSFIEETKTSPIPAQVPSTTTPIAEEKESTTTSTPPVVPVTAPTISISTEEKKDEEMTTEKIAQPAVSPDVRALMELGVTAERAAGALARFGNVEIAANYLLSHSGNDDDHQDGDDDGEGDGEGDDDDETGPGTGIGMMTQAAFRTRLLAIMATRYATDPQFAALHNSNPEAALNQFAQELMQNPQGLFPQGAGIGVHFTMGGPFGANYDDDDDAEGDDDFIPPE